MSLIRVISIFFFIVAIGLATYLFYRVKYKIDEDERIANQEALVINKLKMIRDAETAYQSVTGDYTDDWDKLISFLDTGKLYITQKHEEIFTLSYGRDSVRVVVDTIGTVSVMDSIFVLKEPVSSLVKGTVQNLQVDEGQEVKKGDALFSVQNPNGKTVRVRASKDGTITKIFRSEGSQVEIGERVVLLESPRINDIENLPYLPGSKDKKFELFAGTIVRGNVVVDVFEAKDTDPVNPARKRKGEENPLRVGSRTDVSTSGNWEF